MSGLIIAIFGLGLIIFVHELGHFLAGKLFKLKITEFFVGLPLGRSLWQFKKGETVYGVKPVLLGGYVKFPEFLNLQDLTVGEVKPDSPASKGGLQPGDKILNIDGQKVKDFKDVLTLIAGKQGQTVALTLLRDGQEIEYQVTLASENEQAYLGVGPQATDKISIEDYPRTLEGQSFVKKFLVVAAGPLMNILLAVLLVFVIMKAGLNQPTTTIDKVVPSSPAAKVGIKANDQVISVAGRKTNTWPQVMKNIRLHAGQKVKITVKRDGQSLTFLVNLRKKANNKGLLGIVTKLKRKPLSAKAAFSQSVNFIYQATVFIFQFLAKLVTVPTQVAGQLRSPIGVVQETAPIAQRDLLEYLVTLAGISLAVGIFNVLPLPPLDGGRLMMSIIESLRRKPISKETAMAVNVIGITILLTLMTYVIVADISRLALSGGS